MKIGGGTLLGRLALFFLLICAMGGGAAAGLLFVYASDLPEIRALEDYRPEVQTELYADDGQPVGTFALQRRILLTYDKVPKVLRDAILSTEDQHFEQHWGVDFPRVRDPRHLGALVHRRHTRQRQPHAADDPRFRRFSGRALPGAIPRAR